MYHHGIEVFLANNKNLIVIPIGDEYLRKHKIKSFIKAFFLAFVGPTGEIQRGNVVLYAPPVNNPNIKVDDITKAFKEYFTSQKISLDGKFRFIGIDGNFSYEITYLDGTPTRWDRKRSKVPRRSESLEVEQTTYACYEFYLVTTYYENGVIVDETETYLGTACYGDSNCPGEWESICQPGEGGGGGSGDGTFGDVCCIPDPEMAWESTSSSSIGEQSCSGTYWDAAAQEYLSNCSLNWVYRTDKFWVFQWQWVSNETYVRKGTTMNGPYTFKSIAHLSNHYTGTPAPCTTVGSTITLWNYTLKQQNSLADINIVRISLLLKLFCAKSCEIIKLKSRQ